MYNNSQVPQYPPNTGYSYPPPNFGEYSNSYGYQGYGDYNSQASQPTQQMPTQGNFQTTDWNINYNNNKDKDVLVQEREQQYAQLIKQREDYVNKATVLKRELEQLQQQQLDLFGSKPKNKDLENILVENSKLQEGVQGKLKAVHNVIEMLSGIIKDGKSVNDLESQTSASEKTPSEPTSVSKYSESNSGVQILESLGDKYSTQNVCYVHYDTGLHWCRVCDEFPKTAKDFLLHLQDKKHQQKKKENDVDSTPWHKLPPEPLLPCDENAPKKRIPIKGLQFFISAPSWYCRLCDVWIGDLHCASQHLKSVVHHQNYEIFVSQNPHWEMEWIKDREKSMTRKDRVDSSDEDSVKEKKRKKKSKKKKKDSSDSSSSSSSSDSSDNDRSKSIRVAMRNMKKVQSMMEWNVLERLVEERQKQELLEKEEKNKNANPTDDTLINQWMAVSEPPPKEKILLKSLKDRIREKKDKEQSEIAERAMARREKEREEAERLERKRRDESRAADEAERIKKQREQEEIQKMKDVQLRFKANNYRKRRSRSRSDEDDPDSFRRRGRSSQKRRSKSRDEEGERTGDRKEYEDDNRKPPGPPSYKKLPFIGRMPLFKNKSKHNQEEREERKEIKKQSYEEQRKTRFEPGNLPRAYIPKPEVVCFPKLSSIPPLTLPPPVNESIDKPKPVIPKAPTISKSSKTKPPQLPTPLPPPPTLLPSPPSLMPSPPKVYDEIASDDEGLYESEKANPNTMDKYYSNYASIYDRDIYSDYNEPIPLSHSMPLQPPPLPPDDDLALLGISADDLAAQSF